MKSQELAQLGQEMQRIGEAYFQHICSELNEAVASARNLTYEADHRSLKASM